MKQNLVLYFAGIMTILNFVIVQAANIEFKSQSSNVAPVAETNSIPSNTPPGLRNFHPVVISEGSLPSSVFDFPPTTNVEILPNSATIEIEHGTIDINPSNKVSTGDEPISEAQTIGDKVTSGKNPIAEVKTDRDNTFNSIVIVRNERSVAEVNSNVPVNVSSHVDPGLTTDRVEKTRATNIKETANVDVVDHFPETAREGRKAMVKTEASTHNVPLENIEQQLSNVTNELIYDVMREVLSKLVGSSRAEEIMPKSNDTAPLTKTKRSISPNKVITTKLTSIEFKTIFEKKPKILKKFRTKRSSYASTANNVSPGQLPEALAPSVSSVGQAPTSNLYSTAPAQRTQEFSYATRTTTLKNPIRSSVRSGSLPGSVSDSSKYSTDLSDLPVNRDYAASRMASRVRTEVPAFQMLKVTYEYSLPVQSTRSETDVRKIVHDSRASQFRSTYDTRAQFDDTSDAYGGATISQAPEPAPTIPEVPNVPLLMPDSTPIRISFDARSDFNNRHNLRYKRSPAGPRDLSKRRVPMVLSQVSRFTRGGPGGPL